MISGLTPGVSMSIILVFATSNGNTAMLFAAPTYPTTVRVMAA